MPDAMMPKTVAPGLVPPLSALLLGMFALVPRIDPFAENQLASSSPNNAAGGQQQAG